MLLNVSVIAYGDSDKYTDSKPIVDWREYFRKCENISRSVQLKDISDFVQPFSGSLNGFDVINDIIKNDEKNAEQSVADIVNKFYKLNGAESELMIDRASSLDLADEKIPINKTQPKQSDTEEETVDARPEIEKSVQFVVEAKAIISPLKGKMVNDLVKGDRIKLLLVNRDAPSIKIAETLGGFDEERNYKPIKGRLVEKVSVEKIGFYLYCALAKNAIAKIPEEGNVQIEMADDAPRVTIDEVEKRKVNSNIVLYVVMLIGLIVIAGVLINVLL